MLDFLISTFPRRIVVAIYCLSIAYACAWVPWSVGPDREGRHFRAGYGFVWAGPQTPPVKWRVKWDVFDQAAAEATLQDDQLDKVQHPTLGELKFPRTMPFAERNEIIERMEATENRQAAEESRLRYRAVTSHVDFPRVWLRIAALTAIFLAAFVLLPRPRPSPAATRE